MRVLPLAIPFLILAGCASVRTLDLDPTPEAVASFVAGALDERAFERVSVIPADSVLERWYTSDLRRQRRTRPVFKTRGLLVLDRVGTFAVGPALVDVFVYPTGRDAQLGVQGLQGSFGRQPLEGVLLSAQADYYVTGSLVVRVVTSDDLLDDTSYALDNGLGRPLYRTSRRSYLNAGSTPYVDDASSTVRTSREDRYNSRR